MSKVSKILTASLLLLVLTFLLLTSLRFAGGVMLPAELASWLPQWPFHQAFDAFLSPLAFYGLLTLAALVLVGLLIVLFYPKRYAEIDLLEGKGGKLRMKTSAIESYVATVAEETGYMKSASARVTPYKNRLKVKLSGNLLRAAAVGEQNRLLERNIIDGLHQFFGVEQPMKFTVEVRDIDRSKGSRPSRVE